MERYLQIKEYPNYEVSNSGKIRNIKTGRKIKTFIVNGYEKVGLRNENQYGKLRVHRLVATYFIENPKNFEFVDHIDRDKLNNDSTNLRWVSYNDNKINRLYNKNLIYHCPLTNKFVVQSIKENFDYYFDSFESAIDKFKSEIMIS